MNKFGWMIYEKFRINIDDVVSTPSLAFKIYRTLFMPKDLDSLNIDYYNLFKDAYFGRHITFIPAYNQYESKGVFPIAYLPQLLEQNTL